MGTDIFGYLLFGYQVIIGFQWSLGTDLRWLFFGYQVIIGYLCSLGTDFGHQLFGYQVIFGCRWSLGSKWSLGTRFYVFLNFFIRLKINFFESQYSTNNALHVTCHSSVGLATQKKVYGFPNLCSERGTKLTKSVWFLRGTTFHHSLRLRFLRISEKQLTKTAKVDKLIVFVNFFPNF